ncbi:MAG: metal-dependent hydrolase [Vicinamibacterales bacterium]
MPSPVGHAMAAVAVGLAVSPAAGPARADRWRQAAVLAAAGVAPDLDLLVGRHSMETHSVGAAILVASIAAWRLWPAGPTRTRIWLAMFAAWMSHPICDALSLDTSPPLGVMILWPFDAGHYQTGWSLFAAISRRYWLPEFVWHNALAVVREIVILAPAVAFVVWWRRLRRTTA